jgi:hypothetical protein
VQCNTTALAVAVVALVVVPFRWLLLAAGLAKLLK